MRRGAVWLAAYACFAGALLGGYLWWERRSPGPPPPLDGGGGLGVGGPVDVGQPYSWGTVLLQNQGTRPAVVERARILKSTPNLELAGPVHGHLVGHGHTEADQLILGDRSGFPPTRWPSRPLTAQNVVQVAERHREDGDPDEGLQIVFGLVVTTPGEARATEVEVTYRVGRHRYREVFDYTVTLCAPMAAYKDRSCPEDDARLVPGERALG